MKITLKRNNFHIGPILLGTGFFLVIGALFFIYSIDFSPILLALILFMYARSVRKIEGLPSYVDLLLLTSIAVIITLLTMITFKMSGYAVSAIGFIMLVTLLFDNLELSLIFAVFISFLAGSVEGGNFNLVLSLFSASGCAAMFSYRIRRRSQIIRAGILSGLIQFFVALVVEQSKDFFILTPINLSLLQLNVLNGLISSIIVIGILPIFEYIFKVVTNISLLEMSDFNNPLLRKMILEAPGTYQHSLVVANLAEAATEAIGANSLLARVGSYYHDIGKIPKANYFVENLIPYRDAHKDLKPSISKIIIMNHVKEGAELGQKHRLNPRIIDFIEQHHGRSLVYFFYQRAKELDPEREKEYKEEYRYPGPKAQSKEVAIVGLADTIEAVSRTLEEPTPARIKEMVADVVRRKFMEGELDESNLTLRDLERITQSFVRVLNAIFHTRVSYPKDESANKKSPKNKED
ncbi:MAG: HDIG domain-containing protein [Candidatus Omnitrophica bacterium]|nr:HDIG domain-containing protein [Candidatus Omnitrophota bacterium]